MEILGIQQAVHQGKIFFTDHAVRQMAKRKIDDVEVGEAILAGEIIEEYPDDKYSPSCLVHGQTLKERHLHVVCSLPPRVRIVTVYEPDPAEWEEFRRRKS
ncbi:MAG: DUF4258 domain-containing protein [Anaerolineales bacterium]|nr:DUF4258 domain-containing protein [Anaerolineales bacterium]